MGGVCIVLELDRAIEIIFGKLLGEFEFLQNLKYLVEFDSGNKKLIDPSIPRSFNSFASIPLVVGDFAVDTLPSLVDVPC